jgi:16S rRNA (cytidine1402-2'-O)-methyltransferase
VSAGRRGTLFVVATPIGNLEDLSFRAVRVLREVSRIACEDTRLTARLLARYEIPTPMISFHRFNEHRMLGRLLQRLEAGEDLALVTDGGTPVVSDPGFSLVRAAAERSIAVVPVPGPSALLAALVASGLPAERFTFAGFLPHRSGERRRLLESLNGREETLIFFDSPRRVGDSLREMAAIFGDRPAVLCREMTKLHEEFRRGSLATLAKGAGTSEKGEITLVVEGMRAPRGEEASEARLRREVAEAVARGATRRDAVRSVAARFGVARRVVYGISRKSGNPPLSDEEE